MNPTATDARVATYEPPSTKRAEPTVGRIDSLDLIRGVVMVLMAIDHVRVYSGLPAGGPEPGIFFTRWVTHFCAPAFVFLAGTGAFLHGRKLGDPRALARYLVSRGLILVALELTLIRFSWTFNVAYSEFVLAGVIWMLGWAMVLLAALVRLPAKVVGMIGVAIMALQQLVGLLPRALPDSVRGAIGPVWEFIYPAGLESAPGIVILYVLVPWIGVMAAGYGFGAIVIREPAERRRLCLRIGLGATALFLVVAGTRLALADAPADGPPALLRLLNQQKYPASQLFLLMTLGPTIALLPLAERARGWLAAFFVTFGRVPMFYYLLHIPLIHLTALVVNLIRDGAMHQEWYGYAPMAQVPPEQQWSLLLLYVIFVIDVAILYFPCRWYADIKARRPTRWMRYI
jgi:uncharacterized membrane protein